MAIPRGSTKRLSKKSLVLFGSISKKCDIGNSFWNHSEQKSRKCCCAKQSKKNHSRSNTSRIQQRPWKLGYGAYRLSTIQRCFTVCFHKGAAQDFFIFIKKVTMRNFLVWTIRGYQKMISRYTPPVCRFHPTCSTYAVVAIRTHGPILGGVLSMWRILRCNPFCKGGHDPVPSSKDSK